MLSINFRPLCHQTLHIDGKEREKTDHQESGKPRGEEGVVHLTLSEPSRAVSWELPPQTGFLLPQAFKGLLKILAKKNFGKEKFLSMETYLLLCIKVTSEGFDLL